MGIARAQTPLLSDQLAGPVYFVSHGRNEFPAPIVVLQGEGVSLNLMGSTAINKAGTVSISFDAIPDVPIVRLEIYLPQGPRSVLSANTNLCAYSTPTVLKHSFYQRAPRWPVLPVSRVRENVPMSLLMPVEFEAQNGVLIHRDTKISVTGCSTRKAHVRRHLPSR